MKSKIRVKEIVLGTHRWPDAVEPVEFLRHEHHHNFHITLECDVRHNDREIEFLQLRDYLLKYIFMNYEEKGGIIRFEAMSCEMIADAIRKNLIKVFGKRVWKVYVSEDGVQGGGQW